MKKAFLRRWRMRRGPREAREGVWEGCVHTMEAMRKIYEKLGDRVSVEAAGELERQMSELEEKYGAETGGRMIDSHCASIFTIFGVGA